MCIATCKSLTVMRGLAQKRGDDMNVFKAAVRAHEKEVKVNITVLILSFDILCK
jgi:hypothetical protein